MQVVTPEVMLLKKTKQKYTNPESETDLEDLNKIFLLNYAVGQDALNHARFMYPISPLNQWNSPKIHNPIFETVKEVLEGPRGSKILEKFFKGPEGKKILENEIKDVYGDFEPVVICDMSRKISNDQAEIEIKTYLQNLEDNNLEEFSIFEIVSQLNIPSEQVEAILDKLLIRD